MNCAGPDVMDRRGPLNSGGGVVSLKEALKSIYQQSFPEEAYAAVIERLKEAARNGERDVLLPFSEEFQFAQRQAIERRLTAEGLVVKPMMKRHPSGNVVYDGIIVSGWADAAPASRPSTGPLPAPAPEASRNGGFAIGNESRPAAAFPAAIEARSPTGN